MSNSYKQCLPLLNDMSESGNYENYFIDIIFLCGIMNEIT